jgi:hypothetical protein
MALPERRFHTRLPGVPSKRSMRRRTESGKVRIKVLHKKGEKNESKYFGR